MFLNFIRVKIFYWGNGNALKLWKFLPILIGQFDNIGGCENINHTQSMEFFKVFTFE